jgi:hypothetical protein
MDWNLLLTGIGAGLTYALTGYAKSAQENFDWFKFGTTVTIGLAAGIGMVFLNLPVAIGYEYLITLGLVPVIENLYKAIRNRIMKPKAI